MRPNCDEKVYVSRSSLPRMLPVWWLGMIMPQSLGTTHAYIDASPFAILPGNYKCG